MMTSLPDITHDRGTWGVIGAMFLLFGIALIASCAELAPLLGEGPPPGYIGGNIPESYSGLRNPYMLEDQRALELGRSLYNIDCRVCHGDGGKGDGPKAAYLEPSPANFAAPAMLRAFREHQDYVFWWVSEGVAQTSMPAFKHRLDEAERWQAVTYAWYLGEQATEQ